MSTRRRYTLNFANVSRVIATAATASWNLHPIELAGCIECECPYLTHFHTSGVGVECVRCSRVCAGNGTASLHVIYYERD